ncbi:MAG: neutral zinc metallopeptidase [Ilumatobacteraceae bacterium]
MRSRSLISLLLIGLVLAACGTDGGVVATRSRQNDAQNVPDTDQTATTTTTDGTQTTDSPPTTDNGATSSTSPTSSTNNTLAVPGGQTVIDFGSSKTPRSYDGFLVAAFTDIEKFWTIQFPIIDDAPFTPLKGGIFAAYKSRQEPIPGCGTAQTTYVDVEGNAFYCSLGDFIVYDDDELLPQLVDSLGQSAVGVVLAHEFGHAIQFRNKDFAQPTILKEQQADCFAGAWAAHLSRGETPGLTFGDQEIKEGLIAMIQVRDPVDGGGLADPNAHGTGFDRVGAFQDGFIGGVKRCKTFFTEDREKSLIDIPAVAGDASRGNLPLTDPSHSDIVTLIPNDLTRFWTEQLAGAKNLTFTPPTLLLYPSGGPFPPCKGVSDSEYKDNIFLCDATNQVMVDQGFAQALRDNPVTGDMSVGYLIGEAYSEAVQKVLSSKLTGTKRVLLDDCFTGAWVKDVIPPIPESRGTDGIELSAGDLDEAVIEAIKRSDTTSDVNLRGTAFDKINAFRSCVLGGLQKCQDSFGS